jgi:hypothetical protein
MQLFLSRLLGNRVRGFFFGEGGEAESNDKINWVYSWPNAAKHNGHPLQLEKNPPGMRVYNHFNC